MTGPLEGIRRKRDSPQSSSCLQPAPVDRGAGGPESPGRTQKTGAVGLPILRMAQGGEHDVLRRLGGVTPRVLGQRLARADLQEHALLLRQKLSDGSRETDGLSKVRAPVGGIGRLLVANPR